MKHNTKGEVFACFYITNQNKTDYLRIRFFRMDGGTYVENTQFKYKSLPCPNVNFMKTDITSEQSKVLICFILSSGNNHCLVYDINSDSFSSKLECNDNICQNNYYGLKVNYFSQTNEFVFSCSGEYSNIMYF